jgi:pilus assembly protein CpaE
MKRVLIVEDLPQVAEHLKGMLLREKDVELLGVHPTGEAALKVATSEKPDVVMVDALLQDKKIPPFDLVKRIRAASPATRLVIVTVPQRPVAPRAEEAIDSVFVLPGGANELEDSLGKEPAAAATSGGAQVIAIFSAKGGTGKTTIALNLASHMRRNGANVVLVDGVMQFSSLRAYVPVPADARSIVDLPAGAGMGPAIGDALWEGPAGLTMLLAPPRPEQAELVASADIGNAVANLAKRFEFVIVDTPSRLSEDVLAILDAATVVIMVLNYDPAAVANTRAALDTFEMLGYPGKKRFVVVMNRADVTGGMQRGAVEKTLGMPVAIEVPNDPRAVPESAVKQNPIVLAQANAPVSQSIAQLSAALLATKRK